MFRRPKFIICAAVALYVIALGVAWQQVAAHAEKRVEVMLESADRGFAATINGEVEAALRYVGGALINVFDGKCRPCSMDRLKGLAEAFNVDEINLVDGSGKVIASNLKSVLGFDFAQSEMTRPFLMLTNEMASLVSQPFRPGVANPEMVCKYYGLPFPEDDGFVQIGITVERLRQNMYSYSAAEADALLKDWHFSVVGWYERATGDPEFAPGKIVRRWCDERQEVVIGRYFDYVGYHYLAQLPSSYCYAQRNSSFCVMALVLTVLIVFFTFILVRLVTASAKLEAMHAAAGARNAADLALARTIQMSALPAVEGAYLDDLRFSFDARSVPAREVGGDFYDFYPLSGGRICVLVADVSGKGIPGAMFMMEAKNIIKQCLVEFADVAEAVMKANERLCTGNRAELFVTAWIGALDPRTGEIEYVNAGHNRPFVRRADGSVEKIMGKGGRFLGMFEDAHYRVNALKLEKGDLLYLYTDGVTEAMNEKNVPFGEKRLCEVLADDFRKIDERLRAHIGGAEQSDDITGFMLRWNGEPERVERTFPCAEESLGPAVEFIRSVLTGLSAKTVAALLNAADEITSNIVNYSGSPDFRVEVERSWDRLRLRFSDSGRPYNPLSHIDPDTHAPIENRPVGGLGLVMVKRLVDRVNYVREGGRNVLSLIKKVF